MTRLNDDNQLPNLPPNGQYYYHPNHGPVPTCVPQTYLQTTVLRVQNRCTQMGHPPHCTCMSDPYQSLYSQHSPNSVNTGYHSHMEHVSPLSNSPVSNGFQGPSSQSHTPSHSEYFYGNQASMPPTQYPSPPPYSPQGPIKIPPSHNSIAPDTTSSHVSRLIDHNHRSSINGGPFPTLPLTPDEVVSLPNNSSQQHVTGNEWFDLIYNSFV